ncbi:hypothetical protein SRHO_G00311410 [Serrasalmus rhombeus]
MAGDKITQCPSCSLQLVSVCYIEGRKFEQLALVHLKAVTNPLLDPPSSHTELTGLHFKLQHLDSPVTYTRDLFVDQKGTQAVFSASRPTGLRGRNMKHAVDAGRGASSPDSSPLSQFSRC